jgi:hypothetical protein
MNRGSALISPTAGSNPGEENERNLHRAFEPVCSTNTRKATGLHVEQKRHRANLKSLSDTLSPNAVATNGCCSLQPQMLSTEMEFNDEATQYKPQGFYQH